MDSKASSSIVRLKCDALMHLYDSKQIDGGFATSISAMAGEELGLALIEHYFNKNGIAAKRVIGVPTTGMKSGYRLDGWIKTDSVLYQVEVKNWGANAIGGKVYNGNYKAGWDQFVAWFRNPGLQKVLFKMRAPANLKNITIQPLACMWPIMHPEDVKHPFFRVPVALLPSPAFPSSFTELHIFSMSGYLHQLASETLDLEMPKTAERLRKLQTLFEVDC